MEIENIAAYIDHTALKPETTPDDIARLCDEAKEYHFAAVCVNPVFVKQCALALRNTKIGIACVIGFPLGANTTNTKVFEAKQAMADGATELDMVIPIGLLKAHEDEAVREDIAAVCRAAHPQAIVKVIIEAALLTDEEKVRACHLAEQAGADMVKTSTGFGTGGATVHDVELMRRSVNGKMGVKAAGGIRNYDQALAMIQAGATRLGASAGVKIVQEERGRPRPGG